ncbi:MAG: hypothetical protein ACTSPK_02055 [Candidatus Heimdallarchaeota archaeon]
MVDHIILNKEKLNTLIDIWRHIVDDDKSWVMFEYGTCIILTEPQDDLQTQAIEILKEWGPVVPGTSLGDFNVKNLDDLHAWLVVYTHPDIANYIDSDILRENDLEDQIDMHMGIGLFGRHLRQEDSKTLAIIHIEDKRNNK